MVVMKRTPLLALLALAIFSPLAAEAITVNPVTLSLDNPNQTTAAPSSGVTIVTFSGTLTIDPNYHFNAAGFDFPNNASSTESLGGAFDAAFNTFLATMGTGTYTGNIFSLNVPAGTPADLYAYRQFSNLASEVRVSAFPLSNINSPDGGPPTFTASAAFSVLVTNGNTNGVPEGGSTLLLLGASLAGICVVRRGLIFGGRQK